jgi:hypothetical protein
MNCLICSNTVPILARGMCRKCYRKEPDRRARELAWNKEYEKTPKAKARRRRYNQKFYKSERGKLKAKQTQRKTPYRFKLGIRRAKQRGLSWDLSLEQYSNLLAPGTCFYCSGALNETSIGLDRVNNSKGYSIENVVACCKECNRIKGPSLTCSEMIEIAAVLARLRESRKVAA